MQSIDKKSDFIYDSSTKLFYSVDSGTYTFLNLNYLFIYLFILFIYLFIYLFYLFYLLFIYLFLFIYLYLS